MGKRGISRLLTALLLSGMTAYLAAADHALLLFAKAGDEAMFRKFDTYRRQLEAGLPRLGFGKEAIRVFTEASPYDRQAVLAELDKIAAAQGPSDRLWVFLFGHAQSGRLTQWLKLPKGVLNITELARRLDRISGEQLVFVFTPYSYELQEALKKPERTVIASASAEGESNPPKLPDFLLKKLSAPGEGWLDPVRQAALENSAAARQAGLYQAESPRITAGNKADAYPFTALTDAELPARRARPAGERLAADRPSASLPGVPYFSREREVELIFDPNGTVTETERNVIELNTPDAARQFTVLYLPRAGSTEFEVLTARSLDKTGKVNDGEIAKATGSVRFSGLEPGSRIEYAYRRRYRAGNGLGAFSRLLTLALNYPQQKLKLTLSVPKALRLNFKYGNLPAVPQFREETGPYNRAYVLEFANLPGSVPVPWLPADRLFHPYLRMSALKEWQEFTDWYAKLIEGSDTAGSDVEQLAARLAQGANSDAEKLEKLYDYVNALRYDTTPIGIRGLRPRLPGQVIESGYGDCKDKATLLVALAGKLGIEGYTALLNRAGAADPNFPSWQFNHMLAYFPELEGFPEGLWLDATDTETPFPTLPPGDVNRPALVLTPAGGAFRTVKPGRPEANQLTQNFIFERGRDGRFTFNAQGIFKYRERHAFKLKPAEQLGYLLQSELAELIPGAGLKTFRLGDADTSGTLEPAGTPPAVLLPGFLWKPFALPARSLPVALNDGQPFTFRRIVSIQGYGKLEQAADWKESAGPLTVEVTRSAGENGRYETDTVIRFSAGEVAPADYPAVRRLLLKALRSDQAITAQFR